MPEFFTQYIYTLNEAFFGCFLGVFWVVFKKVNMVIEAI